MSQQTPTHHFHSIISKSQVDGAWIVTVIENDVIVTTQSFPTEFAADSFVGWRPQPVVAGEATKSANPRVTFSSHSPPAHDRMLMYGLLTNSVLRR